MTMPLPKVQKLQYLSLSVNAHIKNAEQRTITQQYGDWYNGR